MVEGIHQVCAGVRNTRKDPEISSSYRSIHYQFLSRFTHVSPFRPSFHPSVYFAFSCSTYTSRILEVLSWNLVHLCVLTQDRTLWKMAQIFFTFPTTTHIMPFVEKSFNGGPCPTTVLYMFVQLRPKVFKRNWHVYQILLPD